MDFTPFLAHWREQHALAGQLLADCSLVVCLGHRGLLLALSTGAPEGLRVVGAATTEAEGLRLVAKTKPRLLVASDQLEQGCGSSLVVEVKRRHPDVRTLLLVSRESRRARLRAVIEAGCEAVLAEARLGQGAAIDALRTLCGGGSYLDGRLRSGAGPLAASSPGLSPREVEVLHGVMQGESNEEIARRLYVSRQTIKTHMANVLRKLEARDRAHAVAIALHRGLVDFSPPGECLGYGAARPAAP
jgi:DNA-binding NarL/FixJ family response regulator